MITSVMTTTLDVAGRHRGANGDQRPGAVKAGLALTYLAAATIPWTGIRFGGFAFGDVFLIFAALTLAGADLRRPLPKLPPWVWALALAVLTIGVANQFAPASQAFTLQRDQLLDNYIIVHRVVPTSTNVVVMVTLIVRILALPFVFGLASAHDQRASIRAAMAFVTGVVISSAVAFVDSRGLSIGPALTGFPVEGTRAGGLTQHPNGVALTCVSALPLIVWQARAARSRTRVLSVLALVLVLLGLYASGSRSGAVATAIAGAVSLGLLPQYRRHLATVGLVVTLTLATLFVVRPGLGASLLSGLRLAGGDASGSDRARSVVNDQGVRDFLHSPIRGIGLEVAGQAHNVYLQALAVGGVVLLAGLLVFTGGALVRSARLAKVEPLAIPLFVAVLGGAIFNAAQNALTPTVVYLTAALIATLPLTATGCIDGEAWNAARHGR